MKWVTREKCFIDMDADADADADVGNKSDQQGQGQGRDRVRLRLKLRGLCVQVPYSQDLVNGRKPVETRVWEIKCLNEPIFLV